MLAAASEALILGAGRRRNGRWIGWSNKELSKNLESSEREARRQCGLILDTLGRDKVREVRDGVTTLNAHPAGHSPTLSTIAASTRPSARRTPDSSER